MTTPNLGLSSTSQTAGSSTYFEDWRLAQDGNISSNMLILDTWAGEVSASIVSSPGAEKIAVIPLNKNIPLSGSEVNYMRIPADMNGWIMTSAEASCSNSPSSGSAIFRVSRISASSIDSGSVVMLTTNIYIDEGTFDSLSASATRRPVISTSASSVWSGDKIKVYTVNSATNVTYAQVGLSFRVLL